MTEIFKMPDIGEGMAEGEISNWLVKVGDDVKEEDAVAEVQNDKLLQEILSPYSGKVTKLFVEPGTVVEVGAPLIEFDGDGSGSAAGETAAPAEKANDAPAAPAEPTTETTSASPAPTAAPVTTGAQTAVNGHILAMPAVRHYARQHQIDLAQVPATGRHGHITMQDVESFAGQGAPAQAPAASASQTAAATPTPKSAPTPLPDGQGEYREPMSTMRKIIAKNMVEQVTTVPHVTLMDEVEVSKLVDHRKTFKPILAAEDIHLTYLPYIAKALTAVAKKHPMLNAHLDPATQEIVFNEHVNVGIAVSVPDGLIVPTVQHAEAKSMRTMAVEINDLAERARNNQLAPAEMSGGTISISNIGSAGGGYFTPILNTNQAAILGVGRIHQAPTVNADGEIVVGQMLRLSLSFDHRLIDGVLAQEAMNDLKKMLTDPAAMLMEV